jgi:glycosyltransferase involved in cell wall biosynthesis
MIQLSIIVPIYNVEQYIAQCLDSVYHQDIPEEEYEVICVNDMSPDSSRDTVIAYQKDHANLYLIDHDVNKKLGGARNTGMRAARGKYILFLDSDDMLKPNCLKQMIAEMESQQDDYIHFNYVKYYDDGKYDVESTYDCTTNQMTGSDLFFCKAIPWQHQISACRKIYCTDFMRRNNLYFEENTMYEDNDFSMRVAATATKCRHLDISPYIYRQNPESVTKAPVSATRLLYWQKTWPIITQLLDTIGKQDSRFIDLINLYMRYDLWDVMNNMYKLPKNQRKVVKHNLSISEWWRYICFLPLKRRIEYVYKLIKA